MVKLVSIVKKERKVKVMSRGGGNGGGEKKEKLYGMGWRGVGEGITIDKTFSLNDVSLNGKSNTQISWVGLLIFKIYSFEKNFHFPFLAKSLEIWDILGYF